MKVKAATNTPKVVTCCILIFISSYPALAQLTEYPIPGSGHANRQRSNAKTQDVPASLTLPFWDDFSYTDTLTYPQVNLWQFGQSVFLNSGLGINPPSKNIVTFDGVDSVGRPYNVNDVLAKGFADKIVSLPIRMDLVDQALRSSTYLSFFYEVTGLGESPDAGDQLIVSFRNSDGKWENMLTLENTTDMDPTKFTQVFVLVDGDRFFHEKFQFRIQNFARLSGPYDTWHVDYVYLNAGRSLTDTSFPDRTVTSTLNSLFVDYYSMPTKHFFRNPSANLKKPSIQLYNLRAGNLQPFDYTTSAIITTKTNGVTSRSNVSLNVAQDPGTILTGLEYLNLTVNKTLAPGDFDSAADSIGILFKFGMSTKDNIPPSQNGDYDAAKYSPIDFRYNDSTKAAYTLASYYAYDDGRAEYGAGLNQAGAYLSYKFLYKFDQPDTLLGVAIYFPDFGDNSSQSLLLEIRRDLSDVPSATLYQQSIVVERNSKNKFALYKLSRYVVLQGDFYVGWKQLTNAAIPVGLDKNTDNGDKVYYNTNGAWIQNTIVKGSIMVRPIFGIGRGDGVVTGIEPEEVVTPIYPNPARRTCYLPPEVENVLVNDITGRGIEVELERFSEKTSLTFINPTKGLVIVRYIIKGKSYAQKVMVQAP